MSDLCQIDHGALRDKIFLSKAKKQTNIRLSFPVTITSSNTMVHFLMVDIS